MSHCNASRKEDIDAEIESEMQQIKESDFDEDVCDDDGSSFPPNGHLDEGTEYESSEPQAIHYYDPHEHMNMTRSPIKDKLYMQSIIDPIDEE